MIYKIPKGKKSGTCLPVSGLTFSNKFDFEITFLKGFDYEYTGDPEFDTSKIFGVSNGWHHLIDSVRIGWNKEKDGNIYFRSLIHQNRKIIRNKIGKEKIEIGEKYRGYIEITDDYYLIFIEDFGYHLYYHNKGRFPVKYKLNPYLSDDLKVEKNILLKIVHL